MMPEESNLVDSQKKGESSSAHFKQVMIILGIIILSIFALWGFYTFSQQGHLSKSPESTTQAVSAEEKRFEIREIDNAQGFDRPATGPEVISFTEAAKHIGEKKTVEGEIKSIINNGKAVYLGFANPHRGVFKVMIKKEHWGNFSSTPDSLYTIGQKIEVTGKIEWYQGDPVIYVTLPDQIVRL